MVVWIIFFLFTEIYSVGVTLLAKADGMDNYALCLIPFVSYFYMDKLTGGFKAMTIPVKKWGKTIIKLFIISLIAYLYGLWGINTLTEKNIEPLIQIMWIPIGFSMFIFYVTTVSSTIKILSNEKIYFKGEWIVCLLFVTIPFILSAVAIKKNRDKNSVKAIN